MRRPLKPFVTEYKGSRRQQSNQSQIFDAPRNLEPPASGTANAGAAGPSPQRPAWPGDGGERARARSFDTIASAEGEDAYEAAMRAADALFTRPGTPPPSDADASFRPTPSARSGTPSAPPSLPSTAPTTPSAGSGSGERPAPERSGRILPVIDERPLPQFAALEAEYAPKRRGRKPGSKNKPKVGKPEPAPVPAGISLADARREAIAHDRPSTFATSDAEPVVAARTPGLQTIEAIVTAETAPRGQRRLVRGLDRVKPGEGWKRRRLPRVCW